MTAATRKASRVKSPDDEKVVEKPEALTPFEAEQLESKLIVYLPAILKRWLPDGRPVGQYWKAPHPLVKSRTINIDLLEGSWREFPAGKSGKTVTGLVIHLTGLDLGEAQQRLMAMIGDTT